MSINDVYDICLEIKTLLVTKRNTVLEIQQLRESLIETTQHLQQEWDDHLQSYCHDDFSETAREVVNRACKVIAETGGENWLDRSFEIAKKELDNQPTWSKGHSSITEAVTGETGGEK